MLKKRIWVTLVFFSVVICAFSNNYTTKKCCAGKCTGKVDCRACSNCSSCKFCVNGNTCGVCAKSNAKIPLISKTKTPVKSSDYCQAITKKKTRCSRKATSNGYCWQHQ